MPYPSGLIDDQPNLLAPVFNVPGQRLNRHWRGRLRPAQPLIGAVDLG